MQTKPVALVAKDAYEAQLGRCVSHNEELHTNFNGETLHDWLLAFFYSQLQAYGDGSLADCHALVHLHEEGYCTDLDKIPMEFLRNISKYTNEQYHRTNGYSNMNSFVELMSWDGVIDSNEFGYACLEREAFRKASELEPESFGKVLMAYFGKENVELNEAEREAYELLYSGRNAYFWSVIEDLENGEEEE